MDFLEGSLQVFELASCLFLQAQSSSPTSAPAVFSVFRALFSCNPVVFLETAGFFQIMTPQVLFPPSQIPESARTAGRCDRRGARTTPRLCPASPLRRLRLLPLPKSACSRSFSALGIPAPLPHVGATSGFLVLGGYTLGCAAKAAQTADTGATARNALPVTAASPAWAHPAPAKSPDRADLTAYAPAAYSRLPSFHAAPLSLPHSGDR